ncbi:short chain dehydrogenase [Streptomyces sp. BR123]|uniref:short chain dehydrogenase n=1 Tax=Streptomyces sp. BR123 TaxID=2749828 RepID=UPI0015C49251|nr:short chain dehydrogenase [Streptomyces sp. BR123]NXY94490.1 short chain dehydrogenase [Streptomyces sp. BR123]
MRILLIGAGGRLGTAVHRSLTARGHEVVTAGRSSGDLRFDVTDPAQITALYEAADAGGQLDAVATAAGSVPFKPVADMTPEDWTAAFRGKVQSQLELVRQGIGRIAPRGSFTLITGVLARSPIVTGSAASMANGAVEAFVRAAAVEIAPQRVNAVSPTVVTEALDVYAGHFPGFAPVDLAEVARAYIRCIEGVETGRILELGH